MVLYLADSFLTLFTIYPSPVRCGGPSPPAPALLACKSNWPVALEIFLICNDGPASLQNTNRSKITPDSHWVWKVGQCHSLAKAQGWCLSLEYRKM